MRSITLILISLMAVSPALAERITDDAGGLIQTYVQRFSQARDSGERIVVDGQCLSACTLVLAFVPRERICVTPNAVFGFHAAWSYDAQGGQASDRAGTDSLWKMYPEHIRRWIRAHGGLHQTLIYLRGPQLAALYPLCAPGLDRASPLERAQTAQSRVRHARHAGHAVMTARAPLGREEAAASAVSGLHDVPRDRR